MQLRFGSGRIQPVQVIASSRSGEPAQLTLRLDKSWFEQESRLGVTFFLIAADERECQLSLEFARPPGRSADARTFTAYKAFDVHDEFGASLLALGGQRAIVTGRSPSVELGLDLFPSLHQGFTFDVGLYLWGADGLDAVAPSTRGAHAALYGWSIFPGYAYRTYPHRLLALSYGAGVGAYALDILGQSDSDPSISKWAPAVRAKVKLGARVSQAVTMGLALTATEVFLGKVGAAHATGAFLAGGIFTEWGG
jgi:hypothetical protein